MKNPFRDPEEAERARRAQEDERNAQAGAAEAEARTFAERVRRPRGSGRPIRWGMLGFGTLAPIALLATLRFYSSPIPKPRGTLPGAVSQAPTASAALPSVQVCETLRERYLALWEAQNHCAADSECVATPRGRQWMQLDGCARYGPREASSPAVDAVASEWLARGCAFDYEDCHRTGEGQCLNGRCAERPPPTLPRSWTRVDVARIFTFFGPPDLAAVEVEGEDSLVRAWSTPRMDLYLDYGPYGGQAPQVMDDGTVVDWPGRRVVGVERLAIDGYDATELGFQERRTAGAPRKRRVGFGYALWFGHAPCSRALLCAAKGETVLHLEAACEAREDCADARAIFRSIEFW